MKMVSLVPALNWTLILVVLADDFFGFLPSFPFFGIVAYLLYMLGFEVSRHLFEIMFGKNSFLSMNKSKRLFAIYLIVLFTSYAFGSPPQLNLVSSPEIFPAVLVFSLLVGGLLFSYLLTKEMLEQTNLTTLSGPIPSFWRKVEKNSRNDDYRKHRCVNPRHYCQLFC